MDFLLLWYIIKTKLRFEILVEKLHSWVSPSADWSLSEHFLLRGPAWLSCLRKGMWGARCPPPPPPPSWEHLSVLSEFSSIAPLRTCFRWLIMASSRPCSLLSWPSSCSTICICTFVCAVLRSSSTWHLSSEQQSTTGYYVVLVVSLTWWDGRETHWNLDTEYHSPPTCTVPGCTADAAGQLPGAGWGPRLSAGNFPETTAAQNFVQSK